NEEDWRTAISDSEQRFGDATVLLNMAGILKFGTIAEMPLAEYMSVINVNQVGVFLGMRAVFEGMKRAGGGSIINVSSVEGLRGSVGLAAYTASKFAVRGMTKVAAGEFGKYDIRVNSVHPGVIDTPMLRAQTGDVDLNKVFKRGVPLRRAGTAADVANLCLFLASDESSYCSGAEFVVDGGATSFVGWGGPVPRPD
ncbi:MAG: SDR family NAD(P)-dependent oxidoreductase, partial [Actinomycetota bacterium]